MTPIPGWQFTPHHAAEQLRKQWQVKTAGGFGFDDDDPAVLATAGLLSYLQETQKTGLSHIRPLRRHVVENHLAIDPATWRSLEIDRTIRSGGTDGSLLSAIDRTRTSTWAADCSGNMAARLAVRCRTYRRPAERDRRACSKSSGSLKKVIDKLDDICDIERIVEAGWA